MNTVKILHCADIHIGASLSFLGAAAENRRRETLLTFEKIVDLCNYNNVQVLAIAGDLFDSDSVEKSFVDAVFQKIASVPNIKVIFAAGNHDPLNSQSPFVKYRTPENLYILGVNETVFTFSDINLRVYGRSFETAFLNGKPSPDIKPQNDGFINLMVQHGELKSDLESEYNSITREFILSSGMDYIALGHIHQKTEIGHLGNTYFAYCGCPEGQGFDELGEKGVLMGEIGKNICNLEFIPTAKRLHIHEKIDIINTEPSAITEKCLETLKNIYGDTYTENLYKLELTGEIPPETVIDVADITARLSEKVYFVKIKDGTQPAINLETISQEKSLRGIFVKKMLEKINNADNEDRKKYERALELGLKAFISEVKFDEN